MPTVIRDQPTSEEVRARLAAEGRPVLVAYSGGKDAMAAVVALREAGIDMVLAHLYPIPGREPGRPLQFVEDGLRRHEDELGLQIHRYPHPSFYRWIEQNTFMAPERLQINENSAIPPPTFDEMWKMIRADLDLPPDTWVADGVRAADSIVRRASFVKHGVMKPKSHKVSPVCDWLKAEVYAAIERGGLTLPVDYEWFGRSFDGIDYRFLAPMREHAPDDYARVLEWFPLADLEIFRVEGRV